MVIGTLRDQIVYPSTNEDEDTPVLQHILAMVGLEKLPHRVGGWDVALNWEDILSVGEQQRIALARLFYHHPRVAILDECTSALNVELQEKSTYILFFLNN
jgi:putative ATP-binding cassette transporter